MSLVKKVMLVLVVLSVAGISWAEECEKSDRKNDRKGRGNRHGKEMFSKLDADGNETISIAEFKVGHEKRIAMHKERLGDKWDESRAAKMPSAEDIFKKIDADEDGELTKSEMRNAHKKRMKAHRSKGGKKGKCCPKKDVEADVEEGV
ncbi:MAG: EF-hand domain-containing protein [Kiritimatiellae bacterium]|nr:EF-hand domain-containing protein [Kiritimatiellia bacterium]